MVIVVVVALAIRPDRLAPAFTGSDVHEIREAEKMSGKKLMYGFNHRHHDSIIKMKELIEKPNQSEVK